MAAAPKNIRDYKLCLSLKKDLAYQILAGSKTYESRIATSSGTKLMNLQVGDVLAFHWYTNERVVPDASTHSPWAADSRSSGNKLG